LDSQYIIRRVGESVISVWKVAPTVVVALEAGHTVVVAPALVFVVVLVRERGQRHTTVGHGDLGRPFDVLTELTVYLVGVSPLRYRALASGEGDSAAVFALDFPVLVVGTGTPAFTGVNAVL